MKTTFKTPNPPKDKPACTQLPLCQTAHSAGHIPLCGIFWPYFFFFLTQKFYSTQISLTLNLFWSKIFFGPKNIFYQNVFWPKFSFTFKSTFTFKSKFKSTFNSLPQINVKWMWNWILISMWIWMWILMWNWIWKILGQNIFESNFFFPNEFCF